MFKIEVDDTYEKGLMDEEDTSLSEAIFSTYPISSGYFSINWNGIYIPLTLNSLSDIIDDIIKMLDSIISGFDFECSFLCESFSVILNFKIYKKNIIITSKWISINTDEIFNLNSSKSVLLINKDKYICEWVRLLSVISNDLKLVGYSFLFLDKKLSFYNEFLKQKDNM
ncbi:hypothetical protein OFY73_001921 [Salmonella enterica]|nr:hypothetical protein [Salmonella enterica subsp. enterica serovar Santiago]ECI4631211.1 hypothetical protein [Salmonella enterica subsp. enterica serovar Hartford]EJB9093827.1 hypothetical protein [Salmonella enterica]EBH8966470.1 hypothetical protein [Salmonella enterica subsp. enterica serovar Santiago]EJB9132904.1 hypothetical protein [Salmonella enterica]